jgi:hypothetical protein
MTKRNAATTLAKSAFAATFGISESQLERLFQKGMPHTKNGRKIEIPMPDGRVWFHEYLVNKGKKAAQPKTIDDAKLRNETARAEMAELELAKARDELMTVDAYERVVTDALTRADAKLQTLSSRIAGVVVGVQTIQEGQARVAPLVEEVRDELRRAEDVPVDDEDDDDADDTGEDDDE